MVINGENFLQERAQNAADWLSDIENWGPHHNPGPGILQGEVAHIFFNENFYPSNQQTQCAHYANFVASKKLFDARLTERQILLEVMFYLAQHAVICPNTDNYMVLTDYWNAGLAPLFTPVIDRLRAMHKVVEVYLRVKGNQVNRVVI